MIRQKQVRVDLEFEKNLNRLFPNMKSVAAKTKELNKHLEKLIYEQHKKK